MIRLVHAFSVLTSTFVGKSHRPSRKTRLSNFLAFFALRCVWRSGVKVCSVLKNHYSMRAMFHGGCMFERGGNIKPCCFKTKKF